MKDATDGSKSRNESVGFVDNISTYPIAEPRGESNDALRPNVEVVEPLKTTAKMRKAQAKNLLFRNLKKVLQKDRTITVNEDRLLYREAPTDEAIQIVVTECLKRAMLYDWDCPSPAGHIRTKRMYDDLRWTYYWPHMASNVH